MIKMESLKLTDLPLEIHFLIVDKLLDPNRLSLSPSRVCGRIISNDPPTLPRDLLHAAQSSPILAEAVSQVVCARGLARSLSFDNTDKLWEWIPFLTEHIKIISFRGIDSVPPDFDMTRREHHQIQCDIHDNAAYGTLDALHRHEVQLDELNLKYLKLLRPGHAKKMAYHVERGIQGCSASLKEMRLGMNQAVVQAIRNVTLPKLTTVHLSRDSSSLLYEHIRADDFSSERAFCGILEALHTNADHLSNISTVRELNLEMSRIVPEFEFESCRRLFLGVKKLSLIFDDDVDQPRVAKFVANFKNLEILKWPTNRQALCLVENMKTIFAECPALKNLNLARRGIVRLKDEIGIPQNSSMMNEFFRSFRGQLRTVNLHFLSSEQIKVLGETSPNLTTLYLSVDHKTVKALPLLLGTHCRQLRELHLEYSRQTRGFGKESWSALTNAISIAPPCFHTFYLIDDMCSFRRAIGGIVDPITKILKIMGVRAKKVRFRLFMKTNDPLDVLKGLKRTLKSAIIHSQSIQSLCLDFFPGNASHLCRKQLSPIEKGEINYWHKKVCKLRDALAAFEHLKEIDVGHIEAIV